MEAWSGLSCAPTGTAAMPGEPLQRASQVARDLDRAYRGWRRAQGFVDPAETSAVAYAVFLRSVRLRHRTRVLFGMPSDEAAALARFLAAHAGAEGT